ncbi:long-chain fatty acid--CoA ligase [uncultured Draconibacterium sp.]|uniref:AMP-dependent synthetase/ligase n=1 Tax=uncultured Draconibacterium sp. TaxID=1573823 RepID=UPI0025F797A2|nr:long-chain fatty acid--CoA ligase [uncultured Draconibacterium sp.]
MGQTVTRNFDVLEYALKEFPREDAIAGKKDGKWYTYSTKEYYKKAHQLAMGLMAMGLKRGDKVATVTTNRPEWSIADMGLAMGGFVHVPIYPTLGDDEYKYILNHAEVKIIIAGDKKLFQSMNPLANMIRGVIAVYTFEDVDGAKNYEEILSLGEANKDKFEEELAATKNDIKPKDLATLIYTSGTTGVPKGVMLSHENLVSNFVAHIKLHNLGKEHKALSFLPLCHVYERSMNYHFQLKGMGVYYVGNLAQIVSSIKEIKPHMFNSVPRLLEKVYDGFVAKGKELSGVKKKLYFWALRLTHHFEYNKKFGPLMRMKIALADKLIYSKWRAALGGNITYIVSGGAALQPQIARVLGMAKLTTLEGYGLTETSPVIAVNNPLKNEMMIGTVGPILEGYDVKFAADGEILCKGPGVMIGYYKAPELTEEVIDRNGWFHTGDIGVLVDDKYLKITDRKKEIFKLSGGKYIAPQMIENKLKTSELIEQVMVIGANEKFASAIISPCFPILHDWAGERKLHYENNEELIQLPEVINKLQKEVAKVNKTLGSHEQISRIRLVYEEWTPASGELSPTLKLRRNAVSVKYQHLINDIYSVGASK